MTIYSKESLEILRQRLDLVEVIAPYVDFKRSGASYKGCCPFHDEKTPSFMIQKGDSHYHCFGCGAHGDAIQFLMSHQKMPFVEAVEFLAQKFQVHLERVEEKDIVKGPNKILLKEALREAAQFFYCCLLHTAEGHHALSYLYERGVDLAFVQSFMLGWAPSGKGIFREFMYSKGFKDEILIESGLLAITSGGYSRDFFSDRIIFPIQNHMGDVIGFSGRKYKEETFGGKYVNTSETTLFKKSKVLFGFNYSRRRIAKQRSAIIVEGQIDTLRLIQSGFNFTVSAQGTAFGEGHVKELLQLGLNKVFLALDADKAGQEATLKVGHFFQKEGVEVKVVSLPEGEDPDSFLMKRGPDAFKKELEDAIDYLSFLVNYWSCTFDIHSPAGKNEIIQNIVKSVREWNHPVMVHETLKKLAHLLQIPEEYIGLYQESTPYVYLKKQGAISPTLIDSDLILESDLLRWLFLLGKEQPRLLELVRLNLKEESFHSEYCRKLFIFYQKYPHLDLLSSMIELEDPEVQMTLEEMMKKKVNKERAEAHLIETIQKILERNWMKERESISLEIQTEKHSEEKLMELLQVFKKPPKIELC